MLRFRSSANIGERQNSPGRIMVSAGGSDVMNWRIRAAAEAWRGGSAACSSGVRSEEIVMVRSVSWVDSCSISWDSCLSTRHSEW